MPERKGASHFPHHRDKIQNFSEGPVEEEKKMKLENHFEIFQKSGSNEDADRCQL